MTPTPEEVLAECLGCGARGQFRAWVDDWDAWGIKCEQCGGDIVDPLSSGASAMNALAASHERVRELEALLRRGLAFNRDGRESSRWSSEVLAALRGHES